MHDDDDDYGGDDGDDGDDDGDDGDDAGRWLMTELVG